MNNFIVAALSSYLEICEPLIVFVLIFAHTGKINYFRNAWKEKD